MYLRVATLLTLFALAPHVRAGTVLNSGGQTRLNASASEVFNQQSTRTPAALPYVDTTHVVTAGGTSSRNTYAFSDSQFSLVFGHASPGTATTFFSLADSSGDVYFSVSQGANYSLSGAYASVMPASGGLQFGVSLTNLTSGATLFSNDQLSTNTSNEAFVLGQQGGDANQDFLAGSLTGALVAGNSYRLTYSAVLSMPTLASTASGNLTLSVSQPPVVPLPASVWTGTALLGALGAFKLRRHLLRHRLA